MAESDIEEKIKAFNDPIKYLADLAIISYDANELHRICLFFSILQLL